MKRRTKRSRCWSHTEGARGFTVTVQERYPGGPIYTRAYDPKLRGGRGGYKRVSLQHSSRELARKYAVKQAALLREGLDEITEERVTLARILSLYAKYKTPEKVVGGQKSDERRSKMWLRVLGAGRILRIISADLEWKPFIKRRRSGEIDSRGIVVEVGKRVPSPRPRHSGRLYLASRSAKLGGQVSFYGGQAIASTERNRRSRNAVGAEP